MRQLGRAQILELLGYYTKEFDFNLEKVESQGKVLEEQRDMVKFLYWMDHWMGLKVE